MAGHLPYCERFGRSLTDERLYPMFMLGARSRCDVLQQYPTHDDHKRNYQGLATHLMALEPELASRNGQIVRHDRPGGWLTDDHRDVA